MAKAKNSKAPPAVEARQAARAERLLRMADRLEEKVRALRARAQVLAPAPKPPAEN